MTFKRKEKGRGLKSGLIIVLCLAAAAAGGWLFWAKFEGEKPEISIDLEKSVLGASTKISGTVRDGRSGVRKIWAGLIKDGSEKVLLEKEPAEEGGREAAEKPVSFSFTINTKELGLKDGSAVLRMGAWDNSWRGWGKGNHAYFEKEISFDTHPPDISVLTRRHNISQGGSGLVVYSLSEDCRKSGVYAGKEFFPGHSGYFQDDSIFISFFALGWDKDSSTRLYVQAVDEAGNTSKKGFYYHIRQKRFKKEVLRISDSFLEMKIPEFESYMDINEDTSMIEKFLYVNRRMRRENNHAILSCGEETGKELYWHGRFIRFPNSARRANFADQRVYSYKGEAVDRAVHMGIDLASVQHAEIPAANAGKVMAAREIGIYGNTVCIDHGYGLFSVYSHLSSIAVDEGSMVSKGQIIGNTGSTGFACGDHLHFGMFIDHVYVNPVEWWDAAWIENNITSKLERVESQVRTPARSPEKAEKGETEPSKPGRD